MMEMSITIGELSSALAKAQAEIKGALKDSNNPFFKSKYADLSSVWEACRKPLTDHGLSVVQTLSGDSSAVIVMTMLCHSSGEWIRDAISVIPVQQTPQGVGSTVTYARRYALAAIAGVAPEDDDGNSGSGKTEQPKAKNDGNAASTKPTTITPDPVNERRVAMAVVWLKERIDADSIDENWEQVQINYERLSNNERMAVDAQLKEKAPGSDRSYRNILKYYLNYKPTPAIGSNPIDTINQLAADMKK